MTIEVLLLNNCKKINFLDKLFSSETDCSKLLTRFNLFVYRKLLRYLKLSLLQLTDYILVLIHLHPEVLG